MNKSYDCESATKLIPLLRIMNREISERSQAVRGALDRIGRLQRNASHVGAREREAEVASLRAQVANHKREIRSIRREIARLGCLMDEADPTTVHIPGRNGELEEGFVWHAGQANVEAVVRKGVG